MPPRKSTKPRAPRAAPPRPAQPRTAAHDVYMVPELRARILRFLANRELKRFMRVEKAVVADVARELYHTVDYARAKNKMTLSTLRQRTYCNAVTVIDARGLVLSPAMMKDIDYGVVWKSKSRTIESYLHSYHVEVLELVIPLLQKKCPNTRKIRFGRQWSDDVGWVVHLNPDRPATGHIDLLTGFNWPLADDPPESPPDLPPAPSGFTMRRQFDLRLGIPFRHSFKGTTPQQSQKWLRALREKSYFSDIGATLNFVDLEIDLDDCAYLSRQQSQSNPPHRLTHITATHVAYFDVPKFQAFAEADLSSLTSLHLSESDSFNQDGGMRGGISFETLPAVMCAVRDNLPNLTSFTMDVWGIGSAEEVMGPLLSEDCLQKTGSIRHLRLQTGAHPQPLFNTLRYLAQFCDPSRGSYASIGSWHPPKLYYISVYPRGGAILEDQAGYLHSLRSEHRSRLPHLATVDFAALGYARLSEVRFLTYRPDGRVAGKAEQDLYPWNPEPEAGSDYSDESGGLPFWGW